MDSRTFFQQQKDLGFSKEKAIQEAEIYQQKHGMFSDMQQPSFKPKEIIKAKPINDITGVYSNLLSSDELSTMEYRAKALAFASLPYGLDPVKHSLQAESIIAQQTNAESIGSINYKQYVEEQEKLYKDVSDKMFLTHEERYKEEVNDTLPASLMENKEYSTADKVEDGIVQGLTEKLETVLEMKDPYADAFYERVVNGQVGKSNYFGGIAKGSASLKDQYDYGSWMNWWHHNISIAFTKVSSINASSEDFRELQELFSKKQKLEMAMGSTFDKSDKNWWIRTLGDVTTGITPLAVETGVPALGLSAVGAPHVATAYASFYMQQMGAGLFIANYLDGVDVTKLSQEQIENINEVAQGAGIVYAAVERAVGSIPALKLGTNVDKYLARKIANKFLQKGMPNTTSKTAISYGVRTAIEAVEEGTQTNIEVGTQTLLEEITEEDRDILLKDLKSYFTEEGFRSGVETSFKSLPSIAMFGFLGNAMDYRTFSKESNTIEERVEFLKSNGRYSLEEATEIANDSILSGKKGKDARIKLTAEGLILQGVSVERAEELATKLEKSKSAIDTEIADEEVVEEILMEIANEISIDTLIAWEPARELSEKLVEAKTVEESRAVQEEIYQALRQLNIEQRLIEFEEMGLSPRDAYKKALQINNMFDQQRKSMQEKLDKANTGAEEVSILGKANMLSIIQSMQIYNEVGQQQAERVNEHKKNKASPFSDTNIYSAADFKLIRENYSDAELKRMFIGFPPETYDMFIAALNEVGTSSREAQMAYNKYIMTQRDKDYKRWLNANNLEDPKFNMSIEIDEEIKQRILSGELDELAIRVGQELGIENIQDARKELINQGQIGVSSQGVKQADRRMLKPTRSQMAEIERQTQNAVRSMQEVSPDTEVVYHRTSDDFAEATGVVGGVRALYHANNKIHVRLDLMTSELLNGENIIAHEFGHRIVATHIVNNPVLQKQLMDLYEEIKPDLPPRIAQDLEKHIAKYNSEQEINYIPEEYISQLIGVMAKNVDLFTDANKSKLNAIGEKLKSLVGKEVIKEEGAIDLLLNVARSLNEGDILTQEDLAFLRTDLNEYSDKELVTYAQQLKLNTEGTRQELIDRINEDIKYTGKNNAEREVEISNLVARRNKLEQARVELSKRTSEFYGYETPYKIDGVPQKLRSIQQELNRIDNRVQELMQMRASKVVQQSPAFKKKFEGSVVTTFEGQPIVMFHATDVKYEDFDPLMGDGGLHFGNVFQANKIADGLSGDKDLRTYMGYIDIKNPLELDDTGTWTSDIEAKSILKQLRKRGIQYSSTPELELAERKLEEFYESGSNSMETEVQLMKDVQYYYTQAVINAIKKAGYDGIRYYNAYESEYETSPDFSYIAFDKEQFIPAYGVPSYGNNNTVRASKITDDETLFEQPEKFLKPLFVEEIKSLLRGEITNEQYVELVKQRRGDMTYKELPLLPSDRIIKSVLSGNKKNFVGRENKKEEYSEGEVIESRLDIPAYTRHGVYVVTVHKPRKEGAESANTPINYLSTMRLKNVTFEAPVATAAMIGTKAFYEPLKREFSKRPVATMKGKYVESSDVENYTSAEEIINDKGLIKETRGTGARFHGTTREELSFYEDFRFGGGDQNIYGGGFYTTDALNIAVGYSKKGRGKDNAVYKVEEIGDLNIYDMEQPLSDVDLKKVNERIPYFSEQAKEGESLVEVLDRVGDDAEYERMVAYEVQEIFTAIQDVFEKNYDGMRHTGGLKTNKKPHDVVIYFNPEKSVKVTKLNLKEIINKEWTQIGYNPYLASYFWTRDGFQPVVGADEVIQIGGLVFAKNVKLASATDPRFKVLPDSDMTTITREKALQYLDSMVGGAFDPEARFSKLIEPTVELVKEQSQSETEFFEAWEQSLDKVNERLDPKSENFTEAAKIALEDMEKFIANNPKYLDYYNKDWQRTREFLNNIIGRDVTDDEFMFYRVVIGLTSPNTLLPSNVADALQVLKMYIDDPKLSGIVLKKNPKTNLFKYDKENSTLVLSSTTNANKARSIFAFLKVVEQQGSVLNAVEFLQEPVTLKELKEFNSSLGYGSLSDSGKTLNRITEIATGESKLIPRMFVFGKKVGAYTLNSTGKTEFTTTDIWESRFIRSYFNNMFAENTGLPETSFEDDLFQTFTKNFNDEFNKKYKKKFEPSALQAVRWFYIIDAFKRAGYKHANTSETISEYTALKSIQYYNIDPRDGRFGDGENNAEVRASKVGRGINPEFRREIKQRILALKELREGGTSVDAEGETVYHEGVTAYDTTQASIERARQLILGEEPTERERATVDEWIERATALYDITGRRILIGNLIHSPRPLTGVERHAIAIHKMHLEDQMDLTLKELNTNKDLGNKVLVQRLQDKLTGLIREYDTTTGVLSSANTSWGQAGVAARVTKRKEMYSSAFLISQAEMAKGSDLTNEERAEIAELGTQINQADRDVAKLEIEVLKVSEKAREDEAETYFRTLLRKKKRALDIVLDERRRILVEIGDLGYTIPEQFTGRSSKVDVDSALLATQIVKLFNNFVEGGSQSLSEAIDSIQGILPQVTRDSIISIISERTEKNTKRKTGIVKDMLSELERAKVILDKIEKLKQGIFDPKREVTKDTAEIKRLKEELKYLQRVTLNTEADDMKADQIFDLIEQIITGVAEVSTANLPPQVKSEKLKLAEQQLREVRRLKRLEAKIDDLKDILRTGELERATIPSPRQPELNDDLKKAIIERNKLQAEVRNRIYALREKSTGEKIAEVMGLPRAILASTDMSYALRQGLIVSAGHPILASKAFIGALQSAFSENNYRLIDDGIKNNPKHALRVHYGLYFSSIDASLDSREEFFATTLLDKIAENPFVKFTGAGFLIKTVKGFSERNMVTGLNLLRAGLFDKFMEDNPTATDKELEAYAAYINVATGRGDLKSLTGGALALSQVFFSPRFTLSRVQAPAYAIKNLGTSKALRKEMMRQWLSLFGVAMTVIQLAKMAGGEVGDDPEEGNFGKITIGDVSIDIFGGLLQPFRVLAITLKAGHVNWVEKDDRYVDVQGVASKFVKYKLAPPFGLGYELVTGKDWVRMSQDVTLAETAYGSLTPIFLQTMLDIRDENISALEASILASEFFGTGTQVRFD